MVCDQYQVWNIFSSKHNGDIKNHKWGWKIGIKAYIYPTKWGFTFYKNGKKVKTILNGYSSTSESMLEELESVLLSLK